MNAADKDALKAIKRLQRGRLRVDAATINNCHVGEGQLALWLVSKVEELEAEITTLKAAVFGDEVREGLLKHCPGIASPGSCSFCFFRRQGIEDFQKKIKERVEKPFPQKSAGELIEESGGHNALEGREINLIREKPLPKPDHQKTQKYIDDLMRAHKDTANSKLRFGEKP